MKTGFNVMGWLFLVPITLRVVDGLFNGEPWAAVILCYAMMRMCFWIAK